MNKTVFITGGTRGIGKTCADLFWEKGYNVVITYEKSEDIANEMRNKYNLRFLAIKCDAPTIPHMEDTLIIMPFF